MLLASPLSIASRSLPAASSEFPASVDRPASLWLVESE